MSRHKNCTAMRMATKAPKPKLTRAQIKAIQKEREASRKMTIEIVERLGAEDRARAQAAIDAAVAVANARLAAVVDPEELDALCRRADEKRAS